MPMLFLGFQPRNLAPLHINLAHFLWSLFLGNTFFIANVNEIFSSMMASVWLLLLLGEKIGSWMDAHSAVLPALCSLEGCFLQIYGLSPVSSLSSALFVSAFVLYVLLLWLGFVFVHHAPWALYLGASTSPIWDHLSWYECALSTYASVHTYPHCPGDHCHQFCVVLSSRCLLVVSEMSVLVSSGCYNNNKIIDWRFKQKNWGGYFPFWYLKMKSRKLLSCIKRPISSS